MLGATTKEIFLATSATSFFCSGENPVVPTTTDFPLSAAVRKVTMLDSGVVKSITASQPSNALARSSETATPFLPRPETSPAS